MINSNEAAQPEGRGKKAAGEKRHDKRVGSRPSKYAGERGNYPQRRPGAVPPLYAYD